MKTQKSHILKKALSIVNPWIKMGVLLVMGSFVIPIKAFEFNHVDLKPFESKETWIRAQGSAPMEYVKGRLMVGVKGPMTLRAFDEYLAQNPIGFSVKTQVLVPLPKGPVFLLQCNAIEHKGCEMILYKALSGTKKPAFIEFVEFDGIVRTQ